MRTRERIAGVALALVLAPAALAGSLTVTATASPAAVLPGLPVALLVTVTNGSADSQAVLEGVRFQVSTGGNTFVARLGDTDTFPFPRTTGCTPAGRCFVLAPGATKTAYFDFGSTLDANPLFLDERLSAPGEYRVQVEIRVDRQAGFEPVLSAPASFTVLTPTGADAVFWRNLQRGSSQGHWSAVDWTNSGRRIASDAYAHHFDSAYLPWVAGLVEGATTDRVAAYDVALAKTLPLPLRSALLYGKAVLLSGASANAAWGDFNADVAVADADAARATLDELLKVATVDAVRQQASALRAQLLTAKAADDLLKAHLALVPSAPLAVLPRVECVRRGDGNAFEAVFGYTNPNRSAKALLIGSNNEVTPAPRDRGQPRFFQPGAHAGVFKATSGGGVLEWHLDGNVATATADFATTCGAVIPSQ